MNLNLEYANSVPLTMVIPRSITLALVGCGGTGSWLAPTIVRLGKLMQDMGTQMDILFVDPDKVEEKNIYRQNFCYAEIGRYKAETLANRYGYAWGMEVQFQNKKFTTIERNRLCIIAGCVDNYIARQDIQTYVNSRNYDSSSRVWWMDSGNGKSSGQVVFGTASRNDVDMGIKFKDDLCTWLPLPSVVHPDLVLASADEVIEDTEAGLSCAELAIRGAQGLTINQRMAATMGEMLAHILITRDLRYSEVSVDDSAGEVRKYITFENIKPYLKENNA